MSSCFCTKDIFWPPNMLLLLLTSSTDNLWFVCLNWKHPSQAVHVQGRRETTPTRLPPDRFSAEENASGSSELVLPGESRSPGEAAAAGAESLQQGAAHVYSSDISRTVHQLFPQGKVASDTSICLIRLPCEEPILFEILLIPFCTCTLKSSRWLMESVWMPLGNLLTLC